MRAGAQGNQSQVCRIQVVNLVPRPGFFLVQILIAQACAAPSAD